MTTEASKLPSKGTEIVSISVVKIFVKKQTTQIPKSYAQWVENKGLTNHL